MSAYGQPILGFFGWHACINAYFIHSYVCLIPADGKKSFWMIPELGFADDNAKVEQASVLSPLQRLAGSWKPDHRSSGARCQWSDIPVVFKKTLQNILRHFKDVFRKLQ
jgi:hypothetical protein